MANLIDRQAAIHKIHKQVWLAETAKTFLADALNELPTVDAVEVVRCKDCKYWDIFDIHSTICPDNKRCKGIIGKMYTGPNFYCAYGERNDE